MNQEIKKNKKSKLVNFLVVGLFCVGLLTITLLDDTPSKSEQNEELKLIRLKKLSFNQAYQIVNNIQKIGTIMMKSQQNKKVNKQLTHGLVYNKLKGTNFSIDTNIISVIQKIPEVYHLVFIILDNNNDKMVSESELSNAIREIYKNSKDQSLINAFCQELFQKINLGQPFNFTQFSTFFNKFLLSLIDGNKNIFENTPPFESSGRRIWDNCFLSVFKILNINMDEFVTLEELGLFLIKISSETWREAKPYIESIFGYMKATGCAYGEKFNLGQLITFGELIRPYIRQILEKYLP